MTDAELEKSMRRSNQKKKRLKDSGSSDSDSEEKQTEELANINRSNKGGKSQAAGMTALTGKKYQ